MLDDPDLAHVEDHSPIGRLTVAEHIDQAASGDLVVRSRISNGTAGRGQSHNGRYPCPCQDAVAPNAM